MSNVRDVAVTMHRLSGAPSIASGTSPETGGLTGHEEPRLDGCRGRTRVRPSGSRPAPLGPAALQNRHLARLAGLRIVLVHLRGQPPAPGAIVASALAAQLACERLA